MEANKIPAGELKWQIQKAEDGIYSFQKNMDVGSSKDITRFQELYNGWQALKGAGKPVPPPQLKIDGTYGKRTIRALNGFKEFYESQPDNVVKIMLNDRPIERVLNPENSPKLPGYQNPDSLRKSISLDNGENY